MEGSQLTKKICKHCGKEYIAEYDFVEDENILNFLQSLWGMKSDRVIAKSAKGSCMTFV